MDYGEFYVGGNGLFNSNGGEGDWSWTLRPLITIDMEKSGYSIEENTNGGEIYYKLVEN